MTIKEYLDPLIQAYQEKADTDKAIQMQKYMKNKFDFLGIPTPARKELNKNFLRMYGFPTISELNQIMLILWNRPEREYQYFAIYLSREMIKKLPTDFIELFEYMIVNKSWWDSVDGISSWVIGEFFQKYPELIPLSTKKWMNSENIWLQRTCLLFQLKYKDKTDVELLKRFITRVNKSSEFFIQKAIGWILREYSKTNPAWVKEFIRNTELKPLSIREGSKYIN